MRLWFLRHGEVEPPYVGAFVGRTDVGLSDIGRHQAQALANFLEAAEADALLTSPRTRAKDTIGPLASTAGMTPTEVPAFAEMDFGEWDGLHWEKIAERDAERAAAWAADPTSVDCPGGESVAAFHDRVRTGLASLQDEFAGRTVVLAAHAGVNRAILASILDIDYLRAFHFGQDYGCANAAQFDAGGRGQIAMLNVVPGPLSADQGNGPASA